MLIAMYSIVLVFWFASGVVEGYKWSTPKRLNSNRLIYKEKDGFTKAKLGYHAWRLIQVTAVLAGPIVASKTTTLPLVLYVGASWLVGTFLYERALDYVSVGYYFPKKTYILQGWELKRRPWQDWLVLTGGVAATALGLIFAYPL